MADAMSGHAAYRRAEDLPAGSVVVDDLRWLAWYANADPGEVDRWDETGAKACVQDSTIDWALQHGAKVLRVGYDDEPPLEEAERYRREARDSARCAGRRAQLLAQAHKALRSLDPADVKAALDAIEAERSESPWLDAAVTDGEDTHD